MKVDYNRGLAKRRHPSGMDVFMYKDTPGVYITAHGSPVPEDVAKAAGFPVDKNRRERLKAERMQEAQRTIEAELAMMGDERVVLETRNDFKLVQTGGGNVMVEDPDGNKLHAVPLPEAIGRTLFDQMAGPAPSSEPPVDQEEAAPHLPLGKGKDKSKDDKPTKAEEKPSKESKDGNS